MSADTWHAFYSSDLQSVYALIGLPLLFLLYRAIGPQPGPGLMPEAARFVALYSVIWTIETIVDAVATGPLLRALGLADTGTATTVILFFVLLGDFRVYVLIFGLLAIARGREWTAAIGTAAAWTFAVPIAAYGLESGLRAGIEGLNPNAIWLVYELLFTALALALTTTSPNRFPGTRPALRSYARTVLLYVAGYYGLWALADVLIQLGGLDLGWLVRIVPNQLYYAFYVPVVFWAFFSRR